MDALEITLDGKPSSSKRAIGQRTKYRDPSPFPSHRGQGQDDEWGRAALNLLSCGKMRGSATSF